MNMAYIAFEKSIERFELYKPLWEKHGKTGIWASTMTSGIETVINLLNVKKQELYFVSIVASEMPDFIEQLSVLRAETTAPILVATYDYSVKEHHEALNNGADFYDRFCETTEENIDGVMSMINSINRRTNQNERSSTLTHGEIMISLLQRKAFVRDVSVDLTRQEFDLLHYFMCNIGTALSYEQIYTSVWNDKYNGSSNEVVKGAVKRLLKKLSSDENNDRIIENMRGFGYKMPL